MNILKRIGQSVFPDRPENKNKQRPAIFRSFLLHFRPAKVSERTLRISYTWGLGGMAFILVFILFGSGLILKFAYQPSTEMAYQSITYLNQQLPFGRLIRNLHRWSGNGLLLVVFLHFLRVFYTRAFNAPRQFNWVIGLGLFLLVIVSNFTGYLMPWDQIAYWAITISTSMLDYVPLIGTSIKHWILGGDSPGQQALLTFYALHTAVLPILMLFMIPFHLWRIRLAKGLVVPRSPDETPPVQDRLLPAVPHLVTRDVALTMVVFATVLLIAMFFDAPLSSQANPGLSPNPTKAPWYFMGIQELLMHFHPVFVLLVVPAMISAGLLMVPYLKEDTDTSGVWFGSHTGRKTTLIAVIFSALLTLGAVLLDEYLLGTVQRGPASLLWNGLLPFGVLLAIAAAFSLLIRKLFSTGKNETIQLVFTLLVTAFVVLTMVGTFLRGPGMKLTWMVG